ncbi:MAG: FGGY family carbohydrate kinase [Verrucomicrobia bacterium]|nr:FGGY family carbohydrate kinase [Verrucomicrobiota bacterium]
MSYHLGLDSSTQSLKGIIIDPVTGTIVGQATVNFSKDLPQYHAAYSPSGDPLEKHADPLLWLAALDLLFTRMQADGAPLDQVVGIGGSGQQHGSVYLNAHSTQILANLDPAQNLVEQIAPALSRKTSPIWMDSSTSAQCAELTAAIGSRLQTDTGSPAIERFTGSQIRKFYQHDPGAYADTGKIHLVSSFMASVLTGTHAPIDFGDGAGMNLLNLKTLTWDPAICAATAPGLLEKLPPAVPTHTVIGNLAPYFTKYGFSSAVAVAAWTGDNPASLVGTGTTRPGLAVVSLGTSDTFFAVLEPYRTDPEGYGHVFGNPTGGFMCLTCFKNGSLARERIREETQVDWTFFDVTAFEKTPAGNDGQLALPWFEAEITPPVLTPGLRANFEFATASPETKIRAIIEAQILSIRVHSQWIGNFDTIRVTGGASRSTGILQTLANVFQAKVETIAVQDSAALGAAMIAAHAVGQHRYEALSQALAPATATIAPDLATKATYEALLATYLKLEAAAKG